MQTPTVLLYRNTTSVLDTKKLMLAVVVALVVLISPAFVAAASVNLVNNGPSSNRVDIVFLGDGYTSANIAAGTYSNHINGMLTHLFTQDPFPRYQNFFNVHRIDVISSQSGADVPPLGIYRNTALDASYYWDSYTERLLYINESKANAALNNGLAGAGFSAEMRLVTVNDTRYGGGGGFYATYAGGNPSAPEVALHELGHSFAGLADEYFYPGWTYSGSEPTAPNVTKDSNPATAKWSDWNGYLDPDHPELGPVGAYKGGAFYENGLYRPTSDSKMRTLGKAFNAVSREEIILSIYDYVNPLDTWLDNSSLLVDPLSLWVNTIDPNVIGTKWYLDDTEVPGMDGELFDLSVLGLAPDTYRVRALAYDTAINDWVRRDVSSPQQSIEWTIQLTAVPEPTPLVLLGGGLSIVLLRRILPRLRSRSRQAAD